MAYNKRNIIIILLLFWQIQITSSGQPIMPGGLILMLQSEFDTLSFRSRDILYPKFIEAFGSSTEDTFLISIKSIIQIGHQVQSKHLLINTGSSLSSKYAIDKILIVKNGIDTMEITLNDLSNLYHYCLIIRFKTGQYNLKCKQIIEERYSVALKKAERFCANVRDRKVLNECKDEFVKTETWIKKGNRVNLNITPIDINKYIQ